MKKQHAEAITIIKHDLKEYFRFLDENKIFSSQRLREDDLNDYKKFLIEQGLEDRDVNNKLSIIKNLLFNI